MIRRSLSLTPILALSLLVVGCGGTEEATPRQAVNPLMRPARLIETAPADFNVRFETNNGDFVVAVHREWSPVGVDRFYNLVTNGF